MTEASEMLCYCLVCVAMWVLAIAPVLGLVVLSNWLDSPKGDEP